MKVVIFGKNRENVFSNQDENFFRRAVLKRELHNRDNPADQIEVFIGEVWPPDGQEFNKNTGVLSSKEP